MRFTLLALLLAGTSLCAAIPTWGVQGALSFPAGDLPDSAGTGLQGGAHLRWDFGRGHGLMARADLTFYGNNHGNSASSLGVGADYTYHLDQDRRGLYFLAGLSVLSYHWTPLDTSSRDNSALGVDLGVGYDLDRRLGLQARYTTHSGSGHTLDALNLGVTFTF